MTKNAPAIPSLLGGKRSTHNKARSAVARTSPSPVPPMIPAIEIVANVCGTNGPYRAKYDSAVMGPTLSPVATPESNPTVSNGRRGLAGSASSVFADSRFSSTRMMTSKVVCWWFNCQLTSSAHFSRDSSLMVSNVICSALDWAGIAGVC